MFKLQERPIDPKEIKKEISDTLFGAIVSFEGIVRSDLKHNKTVHSLLYIADATACLLEGEKIISETLASFPINHAACIQRTGRVIAGETAVWIGVWSSHRAESFSACEYIIENIKKRLLIWKKEYFSDGTSQWIYGASTPSCKEEYAN